ncbi:MAG: SusC/RagA family TonB-linked outer membrane protein, partial [Culicoidibacterales bacterium]
LYKEEDFIIKTNAAGKKTYTLKPEFPQSTLGGMIAPGDIKYVDVNGDGIIDSYDRVRGVGNPSVPEIVYGFGINVEYKNFYASVFFQGVGNTSVLLGGATPEGWYPFSWGVDQSNFRTFALDRWTEENPSQDVLMPRLHKSNLNNRNNTQSSTWWLRNGSFLRLKNLEIGYNIPQIALRKMGFEAARIYLMGYNVAVWDQIKFFDPEAGNGNAGMNYPLPRTFTIGLDFTF